MPTSPYFPNYYSGYSGEQNLAQDLADEQIKLFGTDIYYLPRTILKDNTLDDIIYSKYQDQFQVEMLLQNVQGFGDTSEFISKFGVRITDEVRFILSTRRWKEVTEEYEPELNVQGRPNEGDLLYFPLTQDLYEIKFVERESPFYQFGKIQFFVITAEIYEVGSDLIDTGVEEIDQIEQLFSPAIALTMKIGGTDDFIVGEIITSSTTGDTATVKSWNPDTRVLQLINRKGTFEIDEPLTGDESGAVWLVGTFDTLNNTNSENDFDMNRNIENEADQLVDWAERNPFGEYGDMGVF